MQSRVLTFIFFCLIFVFFSCNSKKQDADNIVEMEFQIVDSLLNDDYILINNSVKMKVPANWTENNELIEPLQAKLNVANPYELSIQKCFMDETTKTILLISSIENLKNDQYETFIYKLKSVKTDNLNYCQYSYKEMIFDQVFSQDSVSINLKLMVYKEAKSKFQLDFIIPVQIYPVISRKIESSIGSITLIY